MAQNPLPKRDFSALSVRDLLEAREAYHVHLAHLDNVIATAIGRYRIRNVDPDIRNPDRPRTARNAPARTLKNSKVTPWSWPCVLVFVKEWRRTAGFSSKLDQYVPSFLYMPDDRVVPTCVVLAERKQEAPAFMEGLTFPSEMIGGGYPVLTDVQQQTHVGSIGCLVTDGNATYALTSRHVTGDVGQQASSLIRGQPIKIGVSDAKQIGKKPFGDVYHGWKADRVFCNLDVGLIRVTDCNYWTAQVFGLGELDDLIDLHPDTISLNLIGTRVRAFGCASGEMVGEIHGLFYRYKSIGGFDYVADLLIGPRDGQPTMTTQQGDSGTLWCYDPGLSPREAREQGRTGLQARRFRPIALQWGGHRLMVPGGDTTFQFALATCISSICRELDVEIIRDWNIGHNEYWGKTGHYKIAAKACNLVSDSKLKLLLQNNLDRISFGDDSIKAGDLRKIDSDKFVPLADVPDLVWRTTRKKDEGNHFADMDQEGNGTFAGKTLLDLCKDPKNVNVDVWNKFYDSLEMGAKRGALPFRVWQMYDAMVDYVKQRKILEFVCTAGIMAHYVGDACQPLHVSHLHHGHNDSEAGVHAEYETKMLDRFAPEIIAGVNSKLKNKKVKPTVKGGHEAAVSVIELMRKTINTLPPQDVIDAYNSQGSGSRIQRMWDNLGERTCQCVANGCLELAKLWASAWKEGGGSAASQQVLASMSRTKLKTLYSSSSFLPALRLKEMKNLW